MTPRADTIPLVVLIIPLAVSAPLVVIGPSDTTPLVDKILNKPLVVILPIDWIPLIVLRTPVETV
jgi:hypothetical protein